MAAKQPHEIFDPVELSFGGQDYTIPPDRVMGAIRAVEKRVRLGEIVDPVRPPAATALSDAFADLLRYAGAQVGDEEVYAAMFGKDQREAAQLSMSVLISMMLPPDRGGDGEAPGKPKAADEPAPVA